MFIYEACPAMLYEAFGPFGIGCFILVALAVDDTDVFCDGCLPLVHRLVSRLFFWMGAVPGGSVLADV